ncbi:metal-dependent hydrolase [Saccharothrix obliqua]|uniref:metal-dependent hydrolase n=1 Tax=Saccharothrix obliqua TaxID=2861747 RepID=UPI001C606770|nr:metal-dependent hydrolase [Saccharothrix obliqua]MBW4716410.1 metal-dependent hydrolase [Saccharothrix obliqua]
MLGKTHAGTGWCAGLALAPLLGAHTLPQAVVVAAVTAGSALVPDLDHPGSRASRLVGPLTGLLSVVARGASRGLYQLTKGPRDEPVSGQHRHATHTLAFAALLGWWINWATGSMGTWAVGVVLAFAVLLAVNALGDWLAVVVALVGLLWLANGTLVRELSVLAGWIGWAVGAGCLVHCLGDALTRSGCPFLWPVPIRGETWYEVRLPALLRFRTGGPVERLLIWPFCVVGGVLLLPGMWPALAAWVG